MAYRSHKIVYCQTLDEINEVLSKVKRLCVNVFFYEKPKDTTFKWDAYIVENPSSIQVSFKRGKEACEYRFYLTGEPAIKEYATGAEAFRILSQYVKIQRVPNAHSYPAATQMLYKNEVFNGKRVKAYSYDMNSAFAFMMLQPIPNIDTLELNTYLKKGQIGFYETIHPTSGNQELKIGFEEGHYYDYVCDLMPSPFEKFVKNWYKRKKNAKTPEEKLRAKNILNFAVGAIQNYNPFLRACIVERCNWFFEMLIDQNTIYANTDSIVSLERRLDLEKYLGDNIGQFKFEHNGDMFAWQKDVINYQWNDEIPVMRGVPKIWFKKFEKRYGRKFDILIDKCSDTTFNDYQFNKEKLIVEEIL